jgi:hypothetical protein
MKTYRVVWLSVCVLIGVIGAAVAAVLSPVAMVFLFLVFGAVGSLLAFGLVDAYVERGTASVLRLLAGGWLAAGIGVGAFVGYASLLGPGVLLLAAAVLAGSPSAVKASGRWFRSVRAPSTAQLDSLARAFAYANPESTQIPAPELRDLTDQPLRERWRPSYRTSQRPPSSAVKPIAAVPTRQMYLDELERRNGSRFRGLDGRGSDTAADPLPFLVGDRVVDWDELTRRQA